MAKKIKNFKNIKDKNIRYKIRLDIDKLILALTTLWLGFVLAISFMEAWLKFKANGVTQQIGLAIGSLVFNALNLVELSIAICLVIIILNKTKYLFLKAFSIPLIILLIQTCYLLPVLEARVEKILAGEYLEASFHHIFYVLLEVIKVITLISIAIRIAKQEKV